ncbi:MAG: hypothetical protein APF77_07770 [Clostridia bacterium BRH_c25]|nr:MAG: hypothetical protein APF77_07770 [Clostridia bacterium BRH_c25]
MINYSKLSYQLKREIQKFSSNISKGLSRPKQKMITQMLYGMLESQSVHLSKIARALKEPITLKKTIDRLSRNLNCFNETGIVFDNYINITSKHLKKQTIFCVDDSDISKPNSYTMESLGMVHDGSKNAYSKGYNMFEIAALTPEHKMPLPAYSRIYSNKEREFVSWDDEVLKGLKYLTKNFGGSGIRTMDRGYDANVYYKYFIKNKENFIMRTKKNRIAYYKGNKYNILELAQRYKGKYKMDFRAKDGRKIRCKISIIPIKLPLDLKKDLQLVVVYGFGKEPLLLISNLKANDTRLPVAITKIYLMRWRIEEYFRFKKQQFGLEDFRVRSLNSIRAMNLFLTVLIGLLSVFSEKQDNCLFIIEAIECSKRIYKKANFIYYALADGIFKILQKTKTGISSFLFSAKSPPSQQMNMFDTFNIKLSEDYAF